MTQLAIFAMHSVLTEEACPLGYLLLRCLRSFNIVDTYTALEVHTTERIASGREALQKYGKLLNVSYHSAP